MNTRFRKAEEQLLAEGISSIIDEPDFFSDLSFQRELTLWLNMKMKKSVRVVSEILDKPKSTIQDDLQRWQECKTIEDMPGRGRGKKRKVQIGKRIEGKQKENRKKTAREIWKELLDEDIDLDYDNVNGHDDEIFKKVEGRRIILITNRNKQRRTQFVQKVLSWRDVKRKRIVWTDEKVFSLSPQSESVILT